MITRQLHRLSDPLHVPIVLNGIVAEVLLQMACPSVVNHTQAGHDHYKELGFKETIRLLGYRLICHCFRMLYERIRQPLPVAIGEHLRHRFGPGYGHD